MLWCRAIYNFVKLRRRIHKEVDSLDRERRRARRDLRRLLDEVELARLDLKLLLFVDKISLPDTVDAEDIYRGVDELCRSGESFRNQFPVLSRSDLRLARSMRNTDLLGRGEHFRKQIEGENALMRFQAKAIEIHRNTLIDYKNQLEAATKGQRVPETT